MPLLNKSVNPIEFAFKKVLNSNGRLVAECDRLDAVRVELLTQPSALTLEQAEMLAELFDELRAREVSLVALQTVVMKVAMGVCEVQL